MPALTNAKRERFVQGLVMGLDKVEAYAQAGYARSDGNAVRMSQLPEVRARLQEIQEEDNKVRQAETLRHMAAQAETLTAKQEVIRIGYDRLREALKSLPIEKVADAKAIGDIVLALDRDQRVEDGGVATRTESVGHKSVPISGDELEAELARIAQERAESARVSGIRPQLVKAQ